MIRNIAIVIIAVFLLSCNKKKKPPLPLDEWKYKHIFWYELDTNNNKKGDTLIKDFYTTLCYKDTADIYQFLCYTQKPIIPQRYFLVSYTTMRVNSLDPIYGNYWFRVTGGMFSRKELDDMVYKSLPMKRKCYQHIVITSIFEFKSESDFNDFVMGSKGDPAPLRQSDCPDCIHIITDTPHLQYLNHKQ